MSARTFPLFLIGLLRWMYGLLIMIGAALFAMLWRFFGGRELRARLVAALWETTRGAPIQKSRLSPFYLIRTPFGGGRLTISYYYERSRLLRQNQILWGQQRELIFSIKLPFDTQISLMHREQVWLLQRLLSREVHTEDGSFDAAWMVYGEPARVSALCQHEVRELILALNERSLQINKDTIVLRLPDVALTHEVLSRLFRNLARLTQLLSQASGPVAPLLLHQIQKDPSPAVQAAAFDRLVALKTRQAQRLSAQVAPQFLQDRNPQRRLEAALQLKDEPSLRTLEALAVHPHHPDTVRGAAWQALCTRHAEPTQLQALWAQLWAQAASELRSALLQTAQRVEVQPTLIQLGDAIRDPQAGTRRRAALILGRMDARATPMLVALLDDDAEVAQAAASALGQVGSGAAFAPLQRVAGSLTTSDAVRQVARGALQRIERRQRTMGGGGLSLAGASLGSGGELSLSAAGAGGELSVSAAGAGGELSASPERAEGLRARALAADKRPTAAPQRAAQTSEPSS